MEKLELWRQQIDEIDDEICTLIEKRLEIAKQIGLFKLKNQLPIVSLEREQEINKRLQKRKYGEQLSSIYEKIFQLSKELQQIDFFLVGKKLDYSLSPLIHLLMGNLRYGLWETEHFESIQKLPFQALNVTNPFKTAAFECCDESSEEAKITKTCNLLVRNNGIIRGFNTDYGAFLATLDFYHQNVKSLKVVIIGNGATSRTIAQALIARGCDRIIYLVREIRNKDEFLIADYLRFSDFQMIINTTPYGTNQQDDLFPLFPLKDFVNLQFVMDVVYNPPLTALLLAAKQLSIPHANGLLMLVTQAALGLQIVKQKSYHNLIQPVFQQLKKELTNLVLIGMPYSGKTTYGRLISKALGRPFFDVDLELEKEGHDLSTLLKKSNLADFRQKEANITLALNQRRGVVIATGGGIVLNDAIMQRLKQKSILIFINTPLSELIKRIDQTRPLAQNQEQLEQLFINRISLYHRYADIIAHNEKEILEKVYEYFNHQWP
ncbi:MAG TPA: shikimate kinase [Bacilli bacterium]|nr:shikimate kinase [Bacilli bacterium]